MHVRKSRRWAGAAVVWTVLTAGLGVSGGARGQSLSLDFDVGISGAWTGAPADAFGGAAGQTGVWADVPIAGSVQNLMGLDGLRTSADLTVLGLSTGYFVDVAGQTGDYDKLFGDGLTGDFNTQLILRFTSLRNGVYAVVTYAADPSVNDPCSVLVLGSAEGSQSVSGGGLTNGFVRGQTHCVHHVAVTNGQLDIVTSDPSAGGQARVGGVQLVYQGGLSTRLYVDSAAAPGGTGATWATAISRLTDALSTAEEGGVAEEIWVKGTHAPRTLDDPTDRAGTFRLLNGVAIYGGFAGSESQLDQRDVDAHPTFLSGNIGQRTSTDNVYHVVTAVGVFSSAVLDGFVISGGYADGGGQANDGGAMWINNANPRVRHCLIRDNYALEGGAVGFFAAPSLARFSHCTFRSNDTQTFGGAVYYRGAAGSQVAFGNCRFLGNTAGGYGGAVYSLNGTGWIQFTNCEFSGNVSTNLSGGAVYAFGSQNDTRFDNCTIWGNRAATGGGVVTAGGATSLDNCILWGNTDTDAGTTVFQANLIHNNGGATANFCDIQGMPPVWAGQGPGCFALDPLFVDADGADNVAGTSDDDLSLLAGSPCIDRGDNGRIPADSADLDQDNSLGEATPLDLSLNPRRMDDPATADLGAGTAPIVDLGAREFRACPADFNGDGFLDFFDYDDYVHCFESGACPPGRTADFNGDGFADFFDYDDFVSAFEAGC